MKKSRLKKMIMAGMLSLGLVTGSAGAFQPLNVQAAIWDGPTLVQGLDRSANAYILPGSDTQQISAETVSGLSDSQKQMAINEIYARHGRKFVIAEVQQYFNEKSWYSGTVEANSFDVSVFSDTEEKNIELLCKKLDYLLPGSNLRYLTDDEVNSLSADDMQLGINEIYARHGRKFDMQQYRDYFNAKPWYNGTIAPADFDESVFNAYESANIEKLVKAMSGAPASSSTAPAQPEIIENFAGDYYRSAKEKEGYLNIVLYNDVSASGAVEGQECGTVNATVYYTDGSMLGLKGTLLKASGNTYRLSGRNLNEAVLTVSGDNVTISGSKGVDGTYTRYQGY